MAEVFLRQVAGFLRTTTCTMNMVEVFLRQSAGFLSTTVEVFLRQIAGFPDTTEHIEHRSTRTVTDMIEDYEVISKLKPATQVSRRGRGRQDTYPASSDR